MVLWPIKQSDFFFFGPLWRSVDIYIITLQRHQKLTPVIYFSSVSMKAFKEKILNKEPKKKGCCFLP